MTTREGAAAAARLAGLVVLGILVVMTLRLFVLEWFAPGSEQRSIFSFNMPTL